MDNNALLLIAGAKKIKQTIGKAGQQGFGVGIYGGDPADLTAIGLSPMQGCKDPDSENYGNYMHTNGSVMVFIPAFCYRIGHTSAPSYSRDGANALEIRDASLGQGDGWFLHRAFIDGGKQKLGFFVDKYLCSKKSDNSNIAVSVKNADQISLTSASNYINSSSMTGCSGRIYDAITLGRARGEGYSCVSAFQWSALSILSLACGQATTSADNCAWYDANHKTNFPKGSNNDCKDINDSSVTFSAHSANPSFGKTGSGTPFAKTTHNGQACGVTEVNGCMLQPLLGIYQTSSSGTFAVVKESYKMHAFTMDNYNTSSNFDTIGGFYNGIGYWGNDSNCAFSTGSTNTERSMFGVFPVLSGASGAGTSLFGNDRAGYYPVMNNVVLVAGRYNDGSRAGVWYRNGSYDAWGSRDENTGFRAAGYAK